LLWVPAFHATFHNVSLKSLAVTPNAIVTTVAMNLQIYIQYPKITIKETFIW